MRKPRFQDSKGKTIYPDMLPSGMLNMNDPLIREGIDGLELDSDSHWNRQVNDYKNLLAKYRRGEYSKDYWEAFPDPEDARMAGDERILDLLSEAQEYLETSAEAKSDNFADVNALQTNSVAKQLARFANIDQVFNEAGVPVSKGIGTDLDQSYLDSRALRGDVPAPYVSEDNGIESRVHTTYEVNPYTNERETVPFLDTRTDKALVTQFGRGVDIGQHDQAGEYTQEKVLKLMGHDVGLNPHQTDNGSRADFLVNDGSNTGIRIDGMVRPSTGFRGSNIELPAITYLRPVNQSYNANEAHQNRGLRYTDNAKEYIQEDVMNLLEDEMVSQNIGLRQAADNLVRDVELRGGRYRTWESDARRNGLSPGHLNKLFRNDPSLLNDPDKDMYDQLIVTGYPQEEFSRNRRHNHVGRGEIIVGSPSTIHSVDLSLANDLISKETGQQGFNALKSKPNQGYHGDQELRVQVMRPMDFNTTFDDKKVISDVTASHPLTGQLLKNLPYA